METVKFNPKENMIEKLAERLAEESQNSDLSDKTIVFPNKRPKHFLLKYLSEKIQRSFIPPVILSMDEFVDKIFSIISPDSVSLSPIESVFLLYITLEKYSHDIDNKLDKWILNDFESFYPYGIKLFQAFEELYIEKVESKELKIYETLIASYSYLSKIYNAFYSKIDDKKFATRAFKYRKVAENLSSSSLPSKINLFFCGLFGLTRSEQKIIETIHELFKDGHIGGSFNIWLYERDSAKDSTIPNIFIYECPDRHGQIYKLSNLISDEVLNEETVIVLPSEDLLFPLLRQGLANLEDDKYNISMGYPILRTPLWSLFECLWRLISSINGEEYKHLLPLSLYLQYMLHPYVKNVKFNGNPAITRMLFHSIENYIRDEEGITLTLNEIENRVFEEAVKREREIQKDDITKLKEHLLEIHEIMLKPFLKIENIEDFAKKSLNMLNYIYKNSTAKFHPLFFPFYYTFIEKIGELSESLIKSVSFGETSSYFRFLRNYLLTVHTPFEGVPLKGLQILGFLETRNLRFKRVFFLDLNEEIFPPLYEDFIIPLKVRQALQLPAFEDRQKLLEYYFRILIDGAEDVFLFYVKDEKKEKSRFLERIIWEREKSCMPLSKECIHYRVKLSADKPESIEKRNDHINLLKNFLYSPSSIDTYIKCPLRFYYSYVLGVESVENKYLESIQIGSIVHEVLSKFFSHFITGQKLKDNKSVTKTIIKLTKEEFKKRYGQYISGSIYLTREQIIKRLCELVKNYYSRLASKNFFKVLAVEERISTTLNGVMISGIVDIIEKREDKTYIIDFKTSGDENKYKIKFEKIKEIIESLSESSGNNVYLTHLLDKAVSSIQLPVYVLCYSRLNGIPLSELSARYLLLGKAKLEYQFEFDPFSDSVNMKEAMDITEKVLNLLFQEILNPQIPFYPTRRLRDTCPYCYYRTTCGTLWIKGRD